MSALLAAEGLVRRYGARPVVDVHRLEVRRGEVLAILGPNGAGKSTLFRLLLLLERPDAGRVLLDGRPAGPGDEAARRRLAGVVQRPHLFAGTVAENHHVAPIHPEYAELPKVARDIAKAKALTRMRDQLQELRGEDWSAAERRTYRPAFIKAYLARMTSRRHGDEG